VFIAAKIQRASHGNATLWFLEMHSIAPFAHRKIRSARILLRTDLREVRMPTVLMTGGHAGIGLEGARTLAAQFGCDLILAGRTPERVEAAAQQLRRETGVRVETLEMDLNSIGSVREAATKCKAMLQAGTSRAGELKSIVCNAGAQFRGPVSYSADGYEQTFAGNCLGHFLLVNMLLDSLTEDGRIVWTASGTHDPDTMDGKSVGAAAEPDARALAHEGKNGKAMSGGRRYATSKLCTILYAYELDRRLRRAGTSMVSIAYDPGFIPETGMGRMAPSIFRNSAVKFLLRKVGFTMGEMPFSGEALGLLAADAGFAGAAGKYFHSKDGELREARSSAVSYEQGKAAGLWSDSEDLVHLESSERPQRLQ
jgi:NAD(P)-dependent dehydrogenase (short-subunit alcohol dehydrogenase family)